MHFALTTPSGFGVIALTIAASIASVATCSDREQSFTHRFTLKADVELALLGFDVSASGDRVASSYWDCEDDTCKDSIRIYRVRRGKVTEEARLAGTANASFGDAIALHGDRLATTNDDSVQIFEHGRTWQLATTIAFDACGNGPPRYLALEHDTLVASSDDASCVWERDARDWRMTSRFPAGREVSPPALADGTIAIASLDSDRVLLFERGKAGFEQAAEITIERPSNVAITDGLLAIVSDDTLHLFDVSGARPRAIATLAAQSDATWYGFGFQLVVDAKTLVATADDGLHAYRRTGSRWEPAGIIPPRYDDHHSNFGISLALAGDLLWIGDPDAADGRQSGGYVHGYERN